MTGNHRRAALIAACAGLALCGSALAQVAPPQGTTTAWRSDSGEVRANPRARGPQVVYQTTVFVPNSAWLRLNFDDVRLGGTIEEGTGSYLRITSLADGAVQILNAESARQWVNTSAYFNGDAVTVELIAYPGAKGGNRLAIRSVEAGTLSPGSPDSICGPTDDRTLSSDNRAARHSVGCTSWLISDTNHQFLTAGHCGASAGSVMSFNVPLSSGSGAIVQAAPQDQYVVDSGSVQGNNGGSGVGDDWCYFGVFPNSTTGLMPVQAYGSWYTVAVPPAYSAGQVIRITGYGTTSSPVSPTWNQVQKTHTGPRVPAVRGVIATTVAYTADTTGGNSGSPVILESSGGIAVGIHTHGYCSGATGENDGTGVNHAGLQNALNNPLGACKTGKGVAGGSVFASGDAVNNFGTCNTTTGNFARIDYGPARMEGLAYNRNTGLFYGISYEASSGARKLYTINPATGAASLLATVTGAAGAINGLGYDPTSNTLYGIIQATGTLVTISPAGVATAAGAANGGTIGALEFNIADGLLYGIDDSGGSKLVKWTSPASAPTVVGTLGAGATDCNGLAIDAAGQFYTINASNDQLLRINSATGAATLVGATGGLFGASFGMSAVLPAAASCYANCDSSTTLPFLNVNDFICFQQKFAAGDTYANCDASTTAPVLNVNDFICFQQQFAAGCSAP